ncbi:MAG: hypothetical protein JNM29_19470 [Candidatus Odyssella sp.]|nr:hypothetical protein [Candidatus Odyssella sp.]
MRDGEAEKVVRTVVPSFADRQHEVATGLGIVGRSRPGAGEDPECADIGRAQGRHRITIDLGRDARSCEDDFETAVAAASTSF